MSAAQDAYSEAQRVIAAAKQDGRTVLLLQGEALRALEDLPPEIAELDKLRFLRVEAPNIADISPLSGMTGITSLYLDDTQITDLTPIKGMTAMTHLSVNRTHITDLTPIKGMAGMTMLSLDNTQIIDLKPIAGMTEITDLWLNNTQITDLTPLAGMTRMKVLGLRNVQISDFTHIAAMTDITHLYIDHTEITDLNPLAGMTQMITLFLEKTQVSNLTPIAEMTGMTNLYLDETQITDLTPLAGMTRMSTLSLSKTSITDLKPIADMKAVTGLFLNDTLIADLTPISAMKVLTTLFLHNTSITDLSSISTMTEITELSLFNTHVIDLRPVRGMRLLIDAPEKIGIVFFGCDAARMDEKIAEIAEIEDNSERAATLFEYLKDWVPPEEVVPEMDPLLQATVIDGRLEIEPSLPTEAERDERLKRLLHVRLGERARELAAAAGNMFPRLASKARVLFGLVDVPFDALDLLSIHLELEVLAARAARGMEDGVAYSDEVKLALEDVTRLGPGLTMDHPDVELMLVRARRAKEAPNAQAEQDARLALSAAIIADAEANGPNSRAMEQLIAELPDQGEALVLREAKQKNLIRLLGIRSVAFLSNRAVAMGDGLLQNAFGGAIGAFIITNWTTILAAAGIYAPWLMGTLGVLMMAHGAKQEWKKRKADK